MNPLALLGLGMGFLKDAQSLRINRQQADLKTPAGLRAAAEKAGFNPLVFAGPGTVGGYSPMFSQGVENAISTLQATEQAKLDRDLRQQEIEQENTRLKLLAQSLTLTDGQRIGPYGNQAVETETTIPATGGVLKTQGQVNDTTVVNDRGNVVNERVTATLFPLKLTDGTIVNVPWNPEDADLGAILGGIGQFVFLEGANATANVLAKYPGGLPQEIVDKLPGNVLAKYLAAKVKGTAAPIETTPLPNGSAGANYRDRFGFGSSFYNY